MDANAVHLGTVVEEMAPKQDHVSTTVAPLRTIRKMPHKMDSMPVRVAEQSKARVYADRLLGLRVRIPPGAWMVVRCECCVFVR